MQADSVISDTITEKIRQNGHRSIRFSPDGFSLLISDASYKPVLLKRYTFDQEVPQNLYPSECERILDESGLLNFSGESVLILDSRAMTLIPGQFFDPAHDRALLEHAAAVDPSDLVQYRNLRERDLTLLFSLPGELESLRQRLHEETKIIPTSECLVSLSDQVKASDHQRGFLMAEVQHRTLDLLVIKGDQIQLLNRYDLNDPSDFIYHTLNTARQLEMDRETTPVYLSGIVHEEHELFGLLGKYIRRVLTTPYYLEELSRPLTLQYMTLSEGSKCA